MSTLKDFYLNEAMRDEVYLYLMKQLQDEAIRKVFNREDVSAVAEAKEIIDKAFESLEIMFPKRSNEKPIVNEAR